VLLAVIVASYQVRMVWSCRRNRPPWCWLRVATALISMYWAGLYLFVLLEQPGHYDSVWFGQVFVRPAFTLTLGVMAAQAITRGQRR
jgi:hypothetical protein